ncbi:MAG: hypothetical protein NZ901_09455 [Geminocystis sp.]|nr:hypothetical protein [Geminocystis sp.]HIK38876.1 hypothetical protein [Geminocystis sp. M7585_C2015_104]MCS7148401.1 hypothetical protein [Geminocystis sp.]MCX8078284.1 hypothetical protein [Geminocystis sp.]MDW8116011.1 hypothetical protein [Geminocystis sp.]
MSFVFVSSCLQFLGVNFFSPTTYSDNQKKVSDYINDNANPQSHSFFLV